MPKIYIPAKSAEQWAQLLADPEKHWRQGFSARALAYSWQEADGFPNEVRTALATRFPAIELLLAIPEHQVSLPGGSRPSQSDIWLLARSGGNLVSIAVEGKVSESFGPTMDEWLVDASPGKAERLSYLCAQVGLSSAPSGAVRYQLLHRTASAVIEAKRFKAAHATVLVHSFSQSDEWFSDYEAYVSLFGAKAAKGAITSLPPREGLQLHFAWVRGDARYLTK